MTEFFLSTKREFGYGFSKTVPDSFRKAFRFISTATGYKLTVVPAVVKPVNQMSSAKSKVKQGQLAKILVVGDSTAYSKFGPYYILAKSLGVLHGATVRIRRWQEWNDQTGQATGPKSYAEWETLHSGAGGSIEISLAALPGSVPLAFLDGSRRPAAIVAGGQPDLIIWHQGHNAQTYERPGGGLWAGFGLYLGCTGTMGSVYPGVPQVIVNQTPWRDNDNMLTIRNAIDGVVSVKPDIMLVDTYSDFLPHRSDPLYYRSGEVTPGVHPSDADGRNLGAQRQAETIYKAWRDSSDVGSANTVDWTKAIAANLCPNGDMAWVDGQAFPTGWGRSGTTVSATKNTTQQYPGFPYCVQIDPGATPNVANFGRLFSAADVLPMRNKTISIAVLAKRSAGQSPPYISFVAKSGGANRTINLSGLTVTTRANAGDWCWYVASNIPIDDVVADFSMGVRVYPSFNEAGNGAPIYVQKVVIVEGALPKGNTP